MALKDILVISGHNGLFRYVSQGRSKVIVENLSSHKRTTIPATSKISMLEDIAIFAENNDVPLREVFRKIQAREAGGGAISHKSSDTELEEYFAETLPEYDRARVYLSDIRKVIMWYNQLCSLGIANFDAPEETDKDGEAVAENR